LLYRKIHIIGGPGSGKTFSAKKLEKHFGLSAFDLDRVFWDQSQDFYVRASEELRDGKLAEILSNDSWIIEGVYYKWLAESFKCADIIIILNPSVYLRQWRIFRRFLYRRFILLEFKKETFSSFMEMFWWNQKFDRDNMVRIHTFISKHEYKVVFCKNHQEALNAISA
jgi:adenylate kinase family enzyme